jgi:protein translocase SecG subunit
MESFITVLQILSCILLVTAILFQPAAKGSSFMASSSQNASMGSSGGTSFLFKLSMFVAAFLMLSSLFLSRNSIQKSKSSVIEKEAPLVPVPSAPPVLPPPSK